MNPDYPEKRAAELAKIKNELAGLPAGDYVLELGCGHGHWLTALALRDKEMKLTRNYVAIDKKPERIEKARSKSKKAGVEINWMRAQIADVIGSWPKACKIKEIFVLFPDPWPKLKQQKHRFVNAELMEKLSEIVEKDAQFYFRSDHVGYCEAVRGLIAESKTWEIDGTAQWPEGMPTTVFEGFHPTYETVIAKRK